MLTLMVNDDIKGGAVNARIGRSSELLQHKTNPGLAGINTLLGLWRERDGYLTTTRLMFDTIGHRAFIIHKRILFVKSLNTLSPHYKPNSMPDNSSETSIGGSAALGFSRVRLLCDQP